MRGQRKKAPMANCRPTVDSHRLLDKMFQPRVGSPAPGRPGFRAMGACSPSPIFRVQNRKCRNFRQRAIPVGASEESLEQTCCRTTKRRQWTAPTRSTSLGWTRREQAVAETKKARQETRRGLRINHRKWESKQSFVRIQELGAILHLTSQHYQQWWRG